MKRLFRLTVAWICAGLICKGTAYAQAPVIHSVTASSSSIQRYEKLELTIQLDAAFTNPYDYDDILVLGIFTSPSGKKDTIEGFYMQEFNLNTSNGNISPSGFNGFRIRYAPAETGSYSYVVICRNTAGVASTNTASFQCSSSGTKGFVRKNNSHYFRFDNGDQYIPIGQNLAWQQGNKYLDFKNWTDKLAANGANFIRLWQCSWGLGIEWRGSPYEGLKRYRQDNCFYTDKLLEECRAKNIYLMLCINHHGMVSSNVNPNWPESPYNAINGGPCANTWDYFINSTAKNLHKNRLRYIIARWGYSRNIMSWELFNEVEWTDNFSTYKTQIKDWHKEMAAYIKQKDPFQHLVTTSYAHSNEDAATWSLPEIDFTQTHFYNGSANMESVLAEGSRNYLSLFNKPTYNGEFGIETNNIDLTTIDPNGIYIHNSVWATLFSGAAGAGSSWWWDNYIDPKNLYFHYKAPALLSNRIPFAAADFKPQAASVSGGGRADLVLSPGADWGLAPANTFTIDASGVISPAASNLCKYIYGATWNTEFRNPPSFAVNFPVPGEFKVQTGASGTSPRLHIFLNGNLVFNQNVNANSSYSIQVPAGNHTIKVDNAGTDWIQVNNYTFTNIGSPVNAYVLKSQDQLRVAGWIHNKRYNWQELRNAGVPPAVNGASLTINGVNNGSYQVKWYDCISGNELSTTSVIVTNGSLQLACPSLAWDAAFTAFEFSTIGVTGIGPGTNLPEADIKLYPNPASGTIFIDGRRWAGKKMQVETSNAIGQVIDKRAISFNNSAEHQMSLTKLVPGIYFLSLTDHKGQRYKAIKFIVQ
jgi:hypothetical protein